MDYSGYRNISFERAGKVLVVTLDRPEALNATDALLHRELSRVFADMARDPEAHAIILTGRGRGFCAGGDLKWMRNMTPEELAAQDFKDNLYRFTFRNIGGLVMPVILKMDFADGTTETVRIPAEIWRKNSKQVTWQYVSGKELKGAELDPLWETADADRGNNVYDGAYQAYMEFCQERGIVPMLIGNKCGVIYKP